MISQGGLVFAFHVFAFHKPAPKEAAVLLRQVAAGGPQVDGRVHQPSGREGLEPAVQSSLSVAT